MEAKKEAIKRVCDEIKAAGLAAALVCPSEEMLFLTGFSPMMCERFQGMFLTAEGGCFYVCNLIYKSEIEHAFGDWMKIYVWKDGESMTEAVGATLREHGLAGKAIGVNSTAQAFNVIDIAESCGVTFQNALHVFEEARIRKNAKEIEHLRKSAHIVDEVFAEVVKFVKPGMKEGEIFDFLCSGMVKRGGTKPWAIVASGINSSFAHYMGKDRVIEKQDMMILDFGCSYHGMYSDMTRTIFVGGITDEQKAVYEMVRRSNEAGEAAAVNGAYIPDVDAAARDIIVEAGYGDNFYNRLGHGIGYMIHEAPDIKRNNRRKLEPGMAFSVEPCVCLPGRFGVRIEDIVVVTENGNEVLNQSTKDIIIV